MFPQLTDNQISAIIGGALGIAGTLIGLLATTLQGLIARRSRHNGVVRILAHELTTNVRELKKLSAAAPLPVRSNYLWEALRGEVPGLLKPEQVNTVAEFYYRQAQVDRLEKPTQEDVNDLANKGEHALRALGIKVSGA
jgi:hypothetical protein